MNLAIIGATGLVGNKILELIEERNLYFDEIITVASKKSEGKILKIKNKDYSIITIEEALRKKPNLAIFSAGKKVSKEWAPQFANNNCYVIDNSSQWRMDSDIKLIVPEINIDILTKDDKIIANPKSTISGEKPILKKTKHWYLPLNKYQKKLERWILEEHKDWKTNVYGQCKSWLDEGLKPRPVTRDLDWGVPVPLKEAQNKVLYVWFDAPIGYISATKEWAKKNNTDWKKYWQSSNTELIHFVGKDNIVFHCIMFPAMLMAHGGYILPKNVPANEFMNLEGQKISTSKDHAIWLPDYLKAYPGKQDVLRYVLCSIAPETKDSDFTWNDFKIRNNSELVAIVGNFVNRVIVLTHKYFKGVVPIKSKFMPVDKEIIKDIGEIPFKLEKALDNFKFRKGLHLWLEIARLGNKYLTETEPWKIKDRQRVATIINLSLQIIANLYIASKIFMPFTALKLEEILNLKNKSWDDIGKMDLLEENKNINKSSFLFERIESISPLDTSFSWKH